MSKLTPLCERAIATPLSRGTVFRDPPHTLLFSAEKGAIQNQDLESAGCAAFFGCALRRLVSWCEKAAHRVWLGLLLLRVCLTSPRLYDV